MPDSLASSGRRLYRKTPSCVTVYGSAPPAPFRGLMLPRWQELLLFLLSEDPRLTIKDARAALSRAGMALGYDAIRLSLRHFRAAAEAVAVVDVDLARRLLCRLPRLTSKQFAREYQRLSGDGIKQKRLRSFHYQHAGPMRRGLECSGVAVRLLLGSPYLDTDALHVRYGEVTGDFVLLSYFREWVRRQGGRFLKRALMV